ncbi:hypothetical protein [Streptomyces niger]|uniref:hypothetical protein n=1 Tax=Streptomyces niger TaxID=66373 RepID=UPI000AD1205F|nr:hypothetical protein [Streptomyces niger]
MGMTGRLPTEAQHEAMHTMDVPEKAARAVRAVLNEPVAGRSRGGAPAATRHRPYA